MTMGLWLSGAGVGVVIIAGAATTWATFTNHGNDIGDLESVTSDQRTIISGILVKQADESAERQLLQRDVGEIKRDIDEIKRDSKEAKKEAREDRKAYIDAVKELSDQITSQEGRDR